MRAAVFRVALLLANERLVSLDSAATSAQHAGVHLLHGFTNAMGHAPRSFVSHAQRAVQLMGAKALLGRAHQMRGQPPLCQRDLGALKYRAHSDRKLALTAVAVFEAGARALGRQGLDALHRATVRARR